MRVVGVVTSKGRPKSIARNIEPLMTRLGIPYIVMVEPQEQEAYERAGAKNLLVLPERDRGMGYALCQAKRAVEKLGARTVLKVDDDVKSIGRLESDLERLLDIMLSKSTVGAVCFPYRFEFYAISEDLITRANKRIQTAYIIKTEAWEPREDVSTFEDFFQYMRLRQKGYNTLFCSKHAIDCVQVGTNEGGLQMFDRSEMARKEIALFQNFDPSITIRLRPEKPWKMEPKFTEKIYGSQKLRIKR